MTWDEFLDITVQRLEAAVKKPMADEPEIEATLKWVESVIASSNVSAAEARRFIAELRSRIEGDSEPLPRGRGWLKKAQANIALLALMAHADQIVAAAAGK